MISLIDASYLKKYLSSIFQIINKELKKFKDPFCHEIVNCLDSLYKTFKNSIKKELDSLIDYILLNGLHE